ncbi:hypothetical protein BD289DRAFT_478376 [Coniella lustricola]|uniref:AA1-like domain-containing protein n=1 Tax=Coniella lustricola TaxID=2025994 RepID=A0A2T3AM87_9PEZI|nr:hypothetical protein BD289DRAFT_478376 [Coniella lustricola]
MKSVTAVAALFAALVAASPAAVKRGEVTLVYWAAADNTFTVSVPIGSSVSVDSDLSFSSISSSSPGNTVCTSYGVDGSVTVLFGSQSDVDIGPPQVQEYVFCNYE